MPPAAKAAPPLPFPADDGQAAVVYRSQDSGRTWQPFADGLPAESTVSGFMVGGGKTYATTEFHGVFVRRGDDPWQSISRQLPKDIRIKAVEMIDGVLVIGTANYGVFTSRDEGETWKREINPLNDIPVRCLLAAGDQLYAGTDQGIFLSSDQGASWQHSFGDVQVNGFAPSGNKIYAGLMNGAVMTDDAGANWRYVYQPLTLHDISTNGRYVYAMTLGGGLLRSDNSGQTWENANQGMGPYNRYTFEVKKIGQDLFAGQWIGIYHSTDEGKTWNLLRGGLPDSTAFCTLEVTGFGLLAGIGLR